MARDNIVSQYSKWRNLSDRIRTTFTPQAPITRRELFVGRGNQISQMLDAIRQPGSHIVVYGERGVGKTSLVTILPPLLEAQRLAGIVVSQTQCDANDTFASICRKMLANLTVTERGTIIHDYTKKLPLPDTLDLWLSDKPSPDELRRLILTLGGRHLIAIIDEFDAIAAKSEITLLLANTIKLLSDTLSPSTIILVGIADTIEGLIAGHASIDRCLSEIHMPRMTGAEMHDLVHTGFEHVKMTIDEEAIRHICRIAQGLPSYVHLISREAALFAVEKRELNVTKAHVITGIQRALKLVPGILMQNWDKATASPKTNNLFKQVLFACALAPKNELGFFTARDVREPFRAITKKDYEIPGYGGSLHLLTELRRASILEKRGESHRWRYRFRSPLMEPYAVMYGLSNKLIEEALVTRFRRDLFDS